MPVFLASNSAPMKGALVPIAYYAVSGTSTNNIYFSNIPQGYQDLCLVINARSAYTATTAQAYTYINNDSSSIYSQTRLYGTRGSASSDRSSGGLLYLGEIPAASAGSTIFGTSVTHFFNYANTTTYKSTITRCSVDLGTSGLVHLWAQLYRSTNAITILSCYNTTGANWVAGTTFSLYGIRSIGQ